MKINYILAILLLTNACSSMDKQQSPLDGGRSETGQPALHAVRDEQLRERFMTEQQLDQQRRKYSRYTPIFCGVRSARPCWVWNTPTPRAS